MARTKKALRRIGNVDDQILGIRGQKVIIDSGLARLYGVSTKRLNEQVKRNSERFPEDFMFQLTSDEKLEVVANCDHLARLKFSPNRVPLIGKKMKEEVLFTETDQLGEDFIKKVEYGQH